MATITGKKLRTNNDVKLVQIVDDVRFRSSIDISLVVAWKARMIARGIKDGDVIRQYTYLKTYGDELKHACEGNNYNLILRRPQGLLLHRFGSFYVCL